MVTTTEEQAANLRDFLKVLDPVTAFRGWGIYVQLWGDDPVRPTDAAYDLLIELGHSPLCLGGGC
jgi:hypothetical protein